MLHCNLRSSLVLQTTDQEVLKMAGGESDALHLLGAYESSSDSERDSGYTSEEDKKRKHDSALHDNQFKSKRRRVEDSPMDEEMIVDTAHHNRIVFPIVNTRNDDNELCLPNNNNVTSFSSNSTSRAARFVNCFYSFRYFTLYLIHFN